MLGRAIAISAYKGNSGRHNNMLPWIMVTGVRIAHGSDDEGWFMIRALQGYRMLGLESYGQLYALVRNFLWVENCQCPALMKLAEYIAIIMIRVWKGRVSDSPCNR
jgi:hypothetical protein